VELVQLSGTQQRRILMMLALYLPGLAILGLHMVPHHGASRAASRSQMLMMTTPIAPKTMGDAKRVFEQEFGRPVSMSVQAFVNEVISSSVPAIVTPGYKYTRVFGLGLVSLCDEFLFEAPDDATRQQIRNSLCVALGLKPDVVLADAAALNAFAEGTSETMLFETLEDLKQIAALDKPLKYTYTLGAGLVTLMKAAGVKPDGDVDSENSSAIDRWCEQLNLSCARTLSRDYAYYIGQQAKMEEIKDMFAQMKSAAERRVAAKSATEQSAETGVPRELIA